MRSATFPRKISNIVELMKLAALAEDFPPETDRIHLANGTLFLDGTFTEGRPEIVRCRLPVAYNPDAPHADPLAGFSGGTALPGGHSHLAGVYRVLPDSQQ